jgi:hypothetical protein
MDSETSDIDLVLDAVLIVQSYEGAGRYRGVVFHEKSRVAEVELTIDRVTRTIPTASFVAQAKAQAADA